MTRAGDAPPRDVRALPLWAGTVDERRLGPLLADGERILGHSGDVVGASRAGDLCCAVASKIGAHFRAWGDESRHDYTYTSGKAINNLRSDGRSEST